MATTITYSNDVLRQKPDFMTVSADTTLKLADNGKTILVGGTSGAYTITLPELKDGLRFRFVVSAVSSGIRTITGGTAAKIEGVIVANGASVAAVNEDNIVLSASSKVGDYVDFICDGSNYYVSGAAAGATITATT
jgi:hypothetical protein